jgi:hypothetical protein
MGEKEKELIVFLAKYSGKSGSLLFARELEKNGVSDLEKVDMVKRMNLADSIVKDILTPVLSRGRVSLARSELMGILEINEGIAGIPTEIDGVRVLPKDIADRASEEYKRVSKFIIEIELKRYGLKAIDEADSKTRIRIIEAFVEHHFGKSGKEIIDCRIDDMGVRDVCNSPMYNKILLMEYILQCMLMFYVNPLRARMLRSELVSVLDIELKMAQGADPMMDNADNALEEIRSRTDSPCSKRLKNDFEDLIVFLLKKECSKRNILNFQESTQEEKNRITSSVLTQILGGMTSFVFSNLSTPDEDIRSKFLSSFLHNYLRMNLPKTEAEPFFARVTNILGIGDSV